VVGGDGEEGGHGEVVGWERKSWNDCAWPRFGVRCQMSPMRSGGEDARGSSVLGMQRCMYHYQTRLTNSLVEFASQRSF